MIWCVEDDASIRDIEVYALQSTGIEARGFEDGTSFWEALNGGEIELVSHLIFKCIAVVFVQASSDYGERR